MRQYFNFYVDVAWVSPEVLVTHELINPATEQVSGGIASGSPTDLDRAVAAAGRTIPGLSS